MAITPYKGSGGMLHSKALGVAEGFASGGPAGAALALASENSPNIAMARKLSSMGPSGGGVPDESLEVDPNGLGADQFGAQGYGLGVNTSMPGAPQASSAIQRRFSLMGGNQ